MAFRGEAAIASAGSQPYLTVTVSGIGGSGPQLGDMILLAALSSGGSVSFTFPSGFNAISGLSQIGINGSTSFAIALKIGTSSEPASYQVSVGTSGYMSLDCRVYSGRSGAFTNVAETLSTDAGTAPATLNVTGLTAASGDDVAMFVGFDNGWTNGAYTYHLSLPSGFANRIDPLPFGAVTFGTLLGSSDYANNPGGALGTLQPIFSSSAGSPDVYYGAFVLSMATASVSVSPSGPMPKQIYVMP